MIDLDKLAEETAKIAIAFLAGNAGANLVFEHSDITDTAGYILTALQSVADACEAEWRVKADEAARGTCHRCRGSGRIEMLEHCQACSVDGRCDGKTELGREVERLRKGEVFHAQDC